MLTVVNMATAPNFEVMSGKFNVMRIRIIEWSKSIVRSRSLASLFSQPQIWLYVDGSMGRKSL
jgi:hypothetical protein